MQYGLKEIGFNPCLRVALNPITTPPEDLPCFVDLYFLLVAEIISKLGREN